ncbi:MAG: penicillin-binding protein 1C [Anaerolineales bacterium]|nr:penicillin-binding protein 1C [Anaerolineales bacterium]
MIVGSVGFYIWLFHDLPSLDSLPESLNIPSIRITDRYGRTLYEILPEEGGRHAPLPLERIPLALRQATIATEDANFYHNPGVDFAGILRAFWINLRGGETLAGGSTITQQVARNLLFSTEERMERSLRRKLREAFLAWQLARSFSKDEILALYLNQINYGGMAYGAEAAAQTYFGKPATELDLAECALLAGLPQAPALYNPFTDLQAAKERQYTVLRLMEEQGYITAEQSALAENEPLILAATPYPIEAPHFSLMVSAELDSLFASEEIRQSDGLIVRTTLDLDWQTIAERAVNRQIEALQDSPDGLGHNVNSAALIALDPTQGDILAMVGSPDYFTQENAGAINMTMIPRQPGSSIKPIVYAAALDADQPNPWTAGTMILDVRTSFLTNDGKAYTPENYDRLEHGPVLVRQALASSLNIPAVATLDHIGLDAMVNMAGKLGISTLRAPQEYDLSLALGGGEVRLAELTAAYAVFANGGHRITPRSILEITDLQGKVVYTPPESPAVQVIDARLAWLITDILSDDDARTLGFGSNSLLNIGRPAAVKTGTTTNFHDNWTIGYTSDLVVGVWAGNTDYAAMRDVTGLTGAAPIWHEFMRAVLTGKPALDFSQPPGLVQIEICTLSGLLPTPDCPYTRLEWFIEGTQPSNIDNLYQTVEIDRATGRVVSASTPPEHITTVLALDLPPQAHSWARSQGLLLLSDLSAFDLESTPSLPSTASFSLSVSVPPAYSIFQITSALPSDSQRIPIEAIGPADLQEVSLWIDDLLLASFTQPPYRTWWALQAGDHQVWASAITTSGETLTSTAITFSVIVP